jgi:TPR repeat protein/tRNA A-37 threonylcarbamoyl transferase component Bud32
MSPGTYLRVRQLLEEALAHPEAGRIQFLQAACGSDAEVLGQVTQLLSAQVTMANLPGTEPARPRHIGRYQISRELGRGAMGIVYEAVDPLIGRKVAVKVIRLEPLSDGTDAAFLRERLFREARTAGGLFHPGIAVILDVGQDGDVAYIAMEYVEGPSLLQMLATRRNIDRGEALRILQQTAAALDFAHAHGVVHRDVKPANILLEKGVTVKVADFGIAKLASTPQYTQTGLTMGTPRYMSPEQLEAKPLDGNSDQFSLAVVAYELLLGAQPFHADSVPALAHEIVYGPRPSARAVNPDLPPEVDQVFFHALGRLPEERYANCSEFVTALERALTPADEAATRVTVPPSDASPAVRNRGGKPARYVVGGAVAATLLAAAGLGYLWMSRAPVAVPALAPPAPHISRFLADPQSIEPGAQAMLIWDVSGAAEVDVEPGIGKRPAAYSVPVKPAKTTTYKLTAANAAGTVGGEALVQVKPTPANANVSISASQLYLDGESKLRANQLADAVALLTKAGELGEVRAMLDLGEIYGQDGAGHIYDAAKALYWYRKAAQAGDVAGMLFLGGYYEVGAAGVPPNDELAARWYRKAANHGSPPATYNLARMYESGQGVPRNLVAARILYQRAADMGQPEAQKWLAQHRRRPR